MATFLIPDDLNDYLTDNNLSARELMTLVSRHLNGEFPVEGLTTGYVDLLKYDFNDWSSVPYTQEISWQNVSLANSSFVSADGNSRIELERLELKAFNQPAGGSSPNILGNSAALKLTMTLANGDFFSIDSTTFYESSSQEDLQLDWRASEALNISYRDARGTSSQSDDTVISYVAQSASSGSLEETYDTGAATYSYVGNGMTLSFDDLFSSLESYSDTGQLLTIDGTFKANYSLVDTANGIRYSFDATGKTQGYGGQAVEDLRAGSLIIANSQREINSVNVSLIQPQDNPESDRGLDLFGVAPDAMQIAAGLDAFLSPIALSNANNITLKNSAGVFIDAGAGNDTVMGSSGGDSIIGGAGNDSMTGAGGNDTLIGGLGSDTMAGGAGADLYWVDDIGDQVIEIVEASDLSLIHI